MRSFFSVLPLSLCLLAAACSSEDKKTTQSPAPASTTSTNEPKDGGSSGSSSSGESELGPECTAYIACCDEVSAKLPQAAASCDSVEKQISDAQKKGASTDQYESACKQGVTGFQAAGYCK